MIETLLLIGNIILGALFAFVLPGWMIVLLFFEKEDLLYKWGYAFLFSIMITTVIAIVLGYNEAAKNFSGGVTAFNIWFFELLICGVLFAIYLMRKKVV